MKMKNNIYILPLSVFLFVCYIGTALADMDDGWDTPNKPDNVVEDINPTLVNMANWLLGFVGLIAVLMVIYGGFLYLTSAGDDTRAENGKKTISYALIGLVIAGFAYAIVKVVVATILT
ncbi:MAG: TrbC/VirB2 family protein [Candidatus Pacebacteria bacterium]|nr:TrbC/VirB2 family protein [Candidatus Paceibacterota bacterium]